LYYNSTENAAVTFYRGGSSVGGFLTFTTNNGTERMRITSAGNVGIGTTSPSQKLEVNGAVLAGDYRGSANIYLTSPDSWMFRSTGGNERMRVTSVGNVGIGTASPRGKLDIVGNTDNDTDFLTIQDNDTSAGSSRPSIRFRSNTAQIGQITGLNGRMRFSSGTTENSMIEILDNGNVGIGTTTPGYLLDLSKTAVSVDTYSGINLQASNYGYTIEGGLTQNVGGELIFSSNNAGTRNPRVKFAANGNVGIGTTSPSAKLDVQGTQGQLFSVTDDLSGDIFSVADISGVPILNVNSSGLVTVDGTSYFDGNVGIGTNSPGAKLEIEGDATGDDTPQLIVASGGVDNNAIIHFTDDEGSQVNAIGALEGNMLTFASQNELIFKTNTSSILGNNDTKMTIDTSGKVGIGTTSPTEKLDVAGIIQSNAFGFQIDTQGYGDIRLRAYYSALNTNATLYVGGVNGYAYKGVYALSFNVNSDYRLKTNVVDLEEAIERVKQINVHRFNWKDRLDEEKVDGFLAHELAEVIPEAVAGEKDAVREDGTLDYQGVDQSKVVPLLTAALQEAISKIEQLEIRIQTLENN
jgi:hypothetical protein